MRGRFVRLQSNNMGSFIVVSSEFLILSKILKRLRFKPNTCRYASTAQMYSFSEREHYRSSKSSSETPYISRVAISCIFVANFHCMMTTVLNDETNEDTNRLVKAKTYRQGWNNDLLALSKFVKEQIFYVVVHDFKNESDDPLDVNHGAICQNLFLKKFPSKVTNVHMKRATKDEMTMYLKDLWTTALNTKGRGNIRRELSSEKSAVYAALNEAFRSKYLDRWV